MKIIALVLFLIGTMSSCDTKSSKQETTEQTEKGKAAEGTGSPHTLINQIRPMSLIIRAMTSNSDSEIIKQIKYLKNTYAKTGFMHESFDKEDASKYTRK